MYLPCIGHVALECIRRHHHSAISSHIALPPGPVTRRAGAQPTVKQSARRGNFLKFPIDKRTIKSYTSIIRLNMLDTKQRILNAAERLIAEQGYAATSLRHIIAEAGVNLASIHYHFGSKAELLDGLIAGKVAPINGQRLELLERAVAEAAPAAPSSESLLRAFMLPMAEAATRDQQFVRVMGRIVSEGLLPAVIEKHFRPTVKRFIAVLREILADLPEEEFQWRIHFMTGAIAHTMCNAAEPAVDFETRIAYLIRFVDAGLRAPAGRGVEVHV